MAFFPPFLVELGHAPLICYTDADMRHHFDGAIRESDAVGLINDFYLNWRQVHGVNCIPDDTDFIIGFLWTDLKEDFVDAQLNRQMATYGECGPMKTLQTFRLNGEFVDPWERGNGCDYTDIVTGREAEHRRAMMSQGYALWDFLHGPRPEMPEGFIIPNWPG